jgi:hypothetical protein
MMHLLQRIADGFRSIDRRRKDADKRRRKASSLRRQVEEAVSATEPKIRLVRGYEARLTPAVGNALAHCRTLVDRMPGPFDIRGDRWGQDPLVTAYFATAGEAKSVLSACPEVRRFFAAGSSPEAYAMLTMAPEEKRIFGTATSGDLVRRDVQRTSLNFSRHRFTSPHAGLSELQEELRQRAFHFLLSCALEHIAVLEEKEALLNREHEILEVQWRLQQSRDRGLAPVLEPDAGPPKTEAGTRILDEIHQQLAAVRSRLDEPSDYLEHVAQVLLYPELFLQLSPQAPRLNQMGIRVKETDADPGNPIPYAEIAMGANGRTLAAVVARVFRSDVMGSTGRPAT